jgi:hypothetical protein
VLALVNWTVMNAIQGTINLKAFHSEQQLEFTLQHLWGVDCKNMFFLYYKIQDSLYTWKHEIFTTETCFKDAHEWKYCKLEKNQHRHLISVWLMPKPLPWSPAYLICIWCKCTASDSLLEVQGYENCMAVSLGCMQDVGASPTTWHSFSPGLYK